jgi:uncharacterized membrane protein YkvA (DUF1232 family)
MSASRNQSSKDVESPRKADRRRLIWRIVFLLAAVIYTVSPIDLIPDLLGPLGWVDDIGLWLALLLVEGYRFWRNG